MALNASLSNSGQALASLRAPKPQASAARMDRRLLGILTLATMLACGNIYYAQPLLGQIATHFHLSAARAGLVPTLTQVGYMCGLFFLTPLGDVLEKRRIIGMLLGLASLALLGASLANSFPVFLVASFLIGLFAVVTQVIFPYVALLSAPDERARNLGTVLSGALVGVLISRTTSGFVGEYLGWRAIFALASFTMILLAFVLTRVLPRNGSRSDLNYPRLLQSVWGLFRDLPELRAISISGAFMYAALAGFWSALTFYLASDAHKMGPSAAGLFGLVGAGSAMAVAAAGKQADRVGARRLVQICIALMLAAYVIFAFFGASLIGLVVGVILLDIGGQAGTLSNQTQIYAFHGAAPSRLNTVYKIFYFGGGALGAAASALAWEKFGWRGVCGAGIFFLVLAAINDGKRFPARRSDT